MDLDYLRLEVENGIACAVVDNPPVNALGSKVLSDIKKAVDEIESNDAIRAAIITGAGKFFSAGADIVELAEINSAKEAENFSRSGHSILRRIENLRKPIIAAINGGCYGGGLELAMACHIRVASVDAQLGQPEINLGVMPGYAGTYRLPRFVGRGRALELLLTGERITAGDAESWGLVNMVVPAEDVMKESKELARKIASFGHLSVEAILRSVDEGSIASSSAAVDVESKYFGRLFETEDKKEGISAFLEKRSPDFKGK